MVFLHIWGILFCTNNTSAEFLILPENRLFLQALKKTAIYLL